MRAAHEVSIAEEKIIVPAERNGIHEQEHRCSESEACLEGSTVEIVIMHRMIMHKSHIAWVFLGTKLSKHGIVP